jgi:hypothetical protein
MKAGINQVWKVSIKPGGTEYPRTVKVTSFHADDDGNNTHAVVENVDTGRRGRIRLDVHGGIAGYEFVSGPSAE